MALLVSGAKPLARLVIKNLDIDHLPGVCRRGMIFGDLDGCGLIACRWPVLGAPTIRVAADIDPQVAVRGPVNARHGDPVDTRLVHAAGDYWV